MRKVNVTFKNQSRLMTQMACFQNKKNYQEISTFIKIGQ